MLSGTYKMPQKYILLVITVLSGFILKSQSNSLVIFSTSGNPFLLKVDEASINTMPQSNIKAFDLSIGWHHIEITSTLTTTQLHLKDSILFVNEPKYANKEFTYELTDHAKKVCIKFKSVSELSGPPTPPIPEAPKIAGPVVDNSIYGNLYKAKDNKPVFYLNYITTTSACYTVLTDNDIQYGVKLLNNCNDEDRRTGYLNQIINLNCYTSAQLSLLINCFPAEMDRLTFAKLAYLHISDKKNVTLLYPSFKYQTIKDNYTTFVEEQEGKLKQKDMKCTQPLEDSKFNEFYAKIKNSGYENEKLTAAKKVLISVCLSSLQLKSLTQLFNHDREKSECLKFAYPILTDKENAAALAEEFQFKETKDDFLKFISK